MEEKILNEIKALKSILSEIIGTGELPTRQQFSKDSIAKAAKEFRKLSIQRGEWISENDLYKILKNSQHQIGKFIREEFDFTDYFKRGKTYYYRTKTLKALLAELKKRNVDLARYKELKDDQANFERYIGIVRGTASKKYGLRAYHIPAELKDILTTPAKRPEPEVMRVELQKLQDEFFGNLLKNGWWFSCSNSLNFGRQSQGEAGSAGEQPVSNKIDAYTITGQSIWLPFLLVIGMRNGLKTHLSLDKYTYHFIKSIRCCSVKPLCKSR